ncbi:phosphoribosylformylglycinamidine synthase [bacterium]|nr:phosphoribosylformylglycinamidine synthase [bacterium]
MKHFYRKIEPDFEFCFNIETSAPLTDKELEAVKWLLSETFEQEKFGENSFLEKGEREVIEIGPRMNFETAYSTNAVSICHNCGLSKILRIERSRRYILPPDMERSRFISERHDRMTECHYPSTLETYETGIEPEEVYEIPLKEKGPDALLEIPGLAMDDWDRNFYYDYFVKQEGRNPTIVEMLDLNNANSEHSRHGYFKGKQIIDGEVMPDTLLQIVKSTLAANPSNSVIAFKDNSSAIRGYDIWTIIPQAPGAPTVFKKTRVNYHIIFTAETHNFPSGVAPFPGAETGTGGRIRDDEGTGRGGLVVAGTTAYCVANLQIPGYKLPWEDENFVYPDNIASALQIEIEASNGASDYGNKFGEPVILGFTRSFDQRLPTGERWGWVKPIMFTGGIGQIDGRHLEKREPEKGMLIIQVGGPAYRIGFGGGAASSMLQGENVEELDFNAVQRGDAEMENKMNRVIRTCIEMGDSNPVASIHDQGAGGPANVLKELVEESGGRIEIRRINIGDPTLSVLEIWVAEYQERCGFLVHPDRLGEFEAICKREMVSCEVLGEVTGDGRFVVHDEKNGTTPVNLNLDKVLGNMPQKTFTDERVRPDLKPLALPQGLTIEDALRRVFGLLSVGSKRFLTGKVDRSVTGLIVQQQCCGPLQLTVSDVAVIAQSHFSTTGAATAVGEQPIKMLVDPKAGARMAVGEAITNIMSAKISKLEDIKCSGNWMWAPKLPGEGAALYDAATAMRDLMVELGIAIDGGKDSLSMATMIGDEIVKSPRELVISAYATVPDIYKVVTPDIKKPGESKLLFIDLGDGKNRMGGSALAQVYDQLGEESPDVESAEILKNAFNAIQELINEGLILAYHDRSDGGLITTLCEMAFAGNCGLNIELTGNHSAIEALFSEELGVVVEYRPDNEGKILSVLKEFGIVSELIGSSALEKQLVVKYNGEGFLSKEMKVLRDWWEETSYQLDRIQMRSENADEEKRNIYDRPGPRYHLTFQPEDTALDILSRPDKPKVAIIREEGSNGDREMLSVFYDGGFEPWDVSMSDLLNGRITLDIFRGIVFVGGFSYADVFDSAKGWAGVISLNPNLRQMFDDFYDRPDTFSLGICNGCQLMALLNWVPWKGIPEAQQPRFIRNSSERFESRWVTVKVQDSPAIMLNGMAGSVFGIWVAHGEGRLYCPDPGILKQAQERKLVALTFVDDSGASTEAYPFNPNGSPHGITGFCTPDGRHLVMMPHFERSWRLWQWPWMPEDWKGSLKASPWLRMTQNIRMWCEER